uniref:Uncharacterized protein n=1 Tax=Bactrocera dorsalis TaxID=27457 RepID=A0A034WBB7_BACDO
MKCAQLSESCREQIFKEFWKMCWKQKKNYVNTLIECIQTKRPRNRRIENASKRSQTLQYHLKANNTILRVCRTLFLNTLGISGKTVLKWLKTPFSVSNSNKHNRGMATQSVQQQELSMFFDSLPATESHYCRATTTKKYLLSEWQSKTKLYDFYKNNWCTEHEKQPLSMTVFNDIFENKKLSLYAPRKDQCDICARYRVGNISEEDYLLHQEKKKEAREEKTKDKNTAQFVFTVDLQAVLMSPKSNVSTFYYRSKLQVHNLVFYNLKNQKAYCFLWHEVEGGLTADEFASIWTYFIEKNILHNLENKNNPVNIIFYSDGCTYQNRNCTMSNALLNTSINNKITIEQKILEIGHTQMEADSVHSVVERALKNKDIYVPADYIGLCKGARKKPEPYDVTYLDHTFFKSFKNVSFFKTIRPGRGTGDSKVTDIRALKYTPDGEIFFKLRFPHEWKILPQRKCMHLAPLLWYNLDQLYHEKRPISKRKYEDLQSLKVTLPKDYHKFYDELPHE